MIALDQRQHASKGLCTQIRRDREKGETVRNLWVVRGLRSPHQCVLKYAGNPLSDVNEGLTSWNLRLSRGDCEIAQIADEDTVRRLAYTTSRMMYTAGLDSCRLSTSACFFAIGLVFNNTICSTTGACCVQARSWLKTYTFRLPGMAMWEAVVRIDLDLTMGNLLQDDVGEASRSSTSSLDPEIVNPQEDSSDGLNQPWMRRIIWCGRRSLLVILVSCSLKLAIFCSSCGWSGQ
ncbi:hypothetical protein PROFUN_14997 [Planoprotostelium fungivorum]|uniref:Uncharacterized protein n=1 Tax=Planoprotostelium fungivorum TaxID=1890364 RepID=A0A2P6MY32_9EUKA|nr:hypothetical protein PROFUN_14997 [Planoprotostelium fungivorum]